MSTVADEASGEGAAVRTVVVAGFWRRAAAALADAACLAPAAVLACWAALAVVGARLPQVRGRGPDVLIEAVLEAGWLVVGLVGLVVVMALLYTCLFAGTVGATPGLRVLGLRIINVYGEPPEWWRLVLRCLGLLLSVALLGAGLLWIAFDREKRGLPDWLAGTYVVRAS